MTDHKDETEDIIKELEPKIMDLERRQSSLLQQSRPELSVEEVERGFNLEKERRSAKDPLYLQWQRKLGRAHLFNKRFTEAIHIFEHAVQTEKDLYKSDDPRLFQSEKYLALAHQLHGRTEDAIRVIEEIVRVGRKI